MTTTIAPQAITTIVQALEIAARSNIRSAARSMPAHPGHLQAGAIYGEVARCLRLTGVDAARRRVATLTEKATTLPPTEAAAATGALSVAAGMLDALAPEDLTGDTFDAHRIVRTLIATVADKHPEGDVVFSETVTLTNDEADAVRDILAVTDHPAARTALTIFNFHRTTAATLN